MANRAERRTGSREAQVEYRIYAEGNALRKEAVVPKEQRQPARKPINYQARKNRARAMQLTINHVIILLAATLVVGVLCAQVLQLQSRQIQLKKDIRNTQNAITELRIRNSNLENAIALSVDLDYVYKVATKKLGMVYPTEDQVIRFERTEFEYVRQFEDIPIAD